MVGAAAAEVLPADEEFSEVAAVLGSENARQHRMVRRRTLHLRMVISSFSVKLRELSGCQYIVLSDNIYDRSENTQKR